jgi:hypothetical protein
MAAMRAPHQRLLSLDEAVERVFQAALSGRSVAEVSAELVHEIDDRDINDALVVGLSELTHRRLARQRRGHTAEDGGVDRHPVSDQASDPAAPPLAAKPHAAREFWAALQANYEAADGSRKALNDFTIDDALHLRSRSNARADGLIRVRDAMDRAISALQAHKVATIGELPAAAKRRIAEGLE